MSLFIWLITQRNLSAIISSLNLSEWTNVQSRHQKRNNKARRNTKIIKKHCNQGNLISRLLSLITSTLRKVRMLKKRNRSWWWPAHIEARRKTPRGMMHGSRPNLIWKGMLKYRDGSRNIVIRKWRVCTKTSKDQNSSVRKQSPNLLIKYNKNPICSITKKSTPLTLRSLITRTSNHFTLLKITKIIPNQL